MSLSRPQLCLIFLVTFQQGVTVSPPWTYEYPEGWVANCPTCGGQRQSPINIGSSTVQFLDMDDIRLSDLYYEHTPFNFTLLNNGHTAQVNINSGDHISIQNGGLIGAYSLVQYHFHWGIDSSRGSEHALNGKYFPAETHFVHYNIKYANLNVALNYPDGVAVLGFVFQLSKVNNTALDAIISHFESITYASESVVIESFPLRNLLPAQLGHFYRYNGSLTTPPCSEAVTWTVFEEPMNISEFQLGRLRSLYEGANSSSPLIASDYRPVQPLNGRRVYSNNPVYYPAQYITTRWALSAQSAAHESTMGITMVLVVIFLETLVC